MNLHVRFLKKGLEPRRTWCSARGLGDERCAACSCPPIPRTAEAREAEEHHRPCGGFGDGQANSDNLPGVVDAICAGVVEAYAAHEREVDLKIFALGLPRLK